MLRSIGAIAAGFVVIAVLAFGTDALIRANVPGVFDANNRVDDPMWLAIILLYVTVYATFGCWLAARLAPDRPMRHALILGALGLVFNVIGASQMWDTAPAWFHVVGLLLVMPTAWLGGWLAERQLARRGPTTPAAASRAA